MRERVRSETISGGTLVTVELRPWTATYLMGFLTIIPPILFLYEALDRGIFKDGVGVGLGLIVVVVLFSAFWGSFVLFAFFGRFEYIIKDDVVERRKRIFSLSWGTEIFSHKDLYGLEKLGGDDSYAIGFHEKNVAVRFLTPWMCEADADRLLKGPFGKFQRSSHGPA
jgi:hypothetical protein